jgi:hypothetical protein
MTETEWLHNGSSETVAPSDKMLEFLRGKPGLDVNAASSQSPVAIA